MQISINQIKFRIRWWAVVALLHFLVALAVYGYFAQKIDVIQDKMEKLK